MTVLMKTGPYIFTPYLTNSIFEQTELKKNETISSEQKWLEPAKAETDSKRLIKMLINEALDKIKFDIEHERILRAEEYYSGIYLKVFKIEYHEFIRRKFIQKFEEFLINNSLSGVDYIQHSGCYQEISKLYQCIINKEELSLKSKSWNPIENEPGYIPIIHHSLIECIYGMHNLVNIDYNADRTKGFGFDQFECETNQALEVYMSRGKSHKYSKLRIKCELLNGFKQKFRDIYNFLNN